MNLVAEANELGQTIVFLQALTVKVKLFFKFSRTLIDNLSYVLTTCVKQNFLIAN